MNTDEMQRFHALAIRAQVFTQGTWILLAVLLGGLLNYVTNVAMGRWLGPVDYGVFVSLLSIYAILSSPVAVIRATIVNYAASLEAMGRRSEIGSLVGYLLIRTALIGVLGSLIFFLSVPRICAYLDISSTAPVTLLGLSILPVAGLPVVAGMLQGLQRFYLFGGLIITGPLTRLISGATLVHQSWGVSGAAMALLLHPTVAFLVGLFLLRDVWGSHTLHQVESHRLLGFSFRTALGLLCLALLTNIDVIMVRSAFVGIEAGRYGALATVGRITLYLSTAITTILFPKAIEQQILEEDSSQMVRRSLGAVLLICCAVTALFFVFPSPIIGGLFGQSFFTDSLLLGLYGMAMSFYALVNVWFYYYLAVGDNRYTHALLAAVVVELALLKLFGTSLPRVVLVLTVTGCSLCLVGQIMMFRRAHSR